MGNARKCDRCKVCFDPYDMDEGLECARFQNPIFQSTEDVKKKHVGRQLINDPSDIYVDLCPDCAEDFVRFMNLEYMTPEVCNAEREKLLEKMKWEHLWAILDQKEEELHHFIRDQTEWMLEDGKR